MKEVRYLLDIEPDLGDHVKAMAGLQGKTMREWLAEAIIAELEDELDRAEGLASMADSEGTMSFKVYLESRKIPLGLPLRKGGYLTKGYPADGHLPFAKGRPGGILFRGEQVRDNGDTNADRQGLQIRR